MSGGLAQGGPGKSKSTTTTTTITTTTPPRKSGARRVGPRRVGPLSQSLGFVLFGFRKFGQNTQTLIMAKVGLAEVGHDWSALWGCSAGW